MNKIIKKISLFIMVLMFTFMTSAYVIKIEPKVLANKPSQVQQNMDFDGEYDWEVDPDTKIDSTDYIKYSDLRTDYIVPIQNSTKSISELETAVQGKLIRFDTAEDLYNFSRDVSFIEQFTTYNPISEMYELNASIDESLVQTLLSLNYVLGRDIDYSVMESRSFDPIAYDFTFQGTSYSNHFTGTFNGQGFEISNLYLSGYDRIVLTDTIGEPIDVPISSYYAMFNYVSGGEIRNFGLIDPNLEILQLNDDLTKLANIVGENNGTIDHVYVVDERESVTEAGIRYRVGNTPIIFQAAGIVHTNNANLSNVYYASKVVVNGNYINKFTLEPIVYTNNSPATTTKIVYDSSRYLLSVTVGSSVFTINSPTHGVAESTSLIKSDQSSLNTGDWYFYPLDGYPILQGMDLVSGYYQIEDAKDLAFFPELIEFISEDYRDASFRLINDIDMSILAAGIYQTPSITFNGQLIGTNDQALDQSDHYYIYNLHQRDYLAINSKIYAGLFSVLGNGSLVKDLNITQSSIVLSNTNPYYSFGLFVGSIAGEMIAGSIEDVYVDVDIDLGEQALGSMRLGGIVGQASGVIERVSNHGNIYVNNHQYQATTLPVDARHYIGGIVGRTSSGKLSLNEVANRGNIDSFQTDSSISLTSGSSLSIHTGGVIGFINNTSVVKHEVVDVTNSGQITIYPIAQPTSGIGRQYVGGVIGLGQGNAPILELNDEVMFAGFVNSGSIHYDFDSGAIQVYAAGVMNTNYTQVYELALMKNSGTLNYIITGASETDFNYASLVNDLGSVDFTLTRIYNEANYTYSSSIYSETYGMVSSLNNNDIIIRYSANYGDISFMNVTLNKNLKVFAITGENNVDYYNVHNYGHISVVDINTGVYSLYIAGFSPQLTSEKVLENSINFGDITFADISGSGLIFVGGFVNTNFSGDLEDFTLLSVQPKATKGIINSMNYGNISTTYDSSNFGVDGTNNTFVGGLVTLNKKSIQDSANLGDIAIVNTSTSSTFSFQTASYYAGLTTSYTGGIVAGGVAAMVIDGLSRIYDTANSGDVIAKAQRFVRAGGVLGVSLYEESTSGRITSSMGLVNTIQNSVLSNGLNFGNISAITSIIATYSTSSDSFSGDLYVGSNPSTNSTVTFSGSHTIGTSDRPAVYASAGGVIGYGLSIMRNMLNHGTISSTDVAGGVVGATYALGASSGTYTTVVNISTAVNYGVIKSISNSNYGNISNVNLNESIIDDYYMADNNTFIYPSGFSRELPRGKRGFGGIFGRLQRGLNGVMTSSGGAFDFIVNANPNIDLIGRLDQVENFSSSLRFFRFVGAKYYSAKLNDTTQVVFTGFEYASKYYSSGPYLDVVEVNYLGYNQNGSLYDHYYEIVLEVWNAYWQQGNTNSLITIVEIEYDIITTSSTSQPSSNYNVGDEYTDNYNNGNAYLGARDVPWITENPNDTNITNSDTQYIYDPDFEMRTNTDLTEYIYYAEEDLLADRFQTGGENPRPNGMYVLSTSAGQTYGAVLPRNIDRNETEILDEDLLPPIDFYDEVDDYRLSLQSIIVDTNNNLSAIDLYNGLRQTTYSDQANLIDDDINQQFTIEEVGGSNNQLTAFDVTNYLGSGYNLGIDYDNNIITMAISMEAFDPLQTSVTFEISQAFTSSNALIGIRRGDWASSTMALQDALYLERYTDIATNANTKASLTVNLPDYDITSAQILSLGYFSIYSEAFYMDPLDSSYEFSNDLYYNDYEVRMIFMPNLNQASNTTGITSVSFNGAANVNITSANNVDLRSNGTVNYNGSLRLNYVDNNDILIPGYDFKDLFTLYYNDDTLVPSTYYTVSTIPTSLSGTYSITFTFSELIRSGDYYIEFSYFPNSTMYRIDFDKGAAPNNQLIDFTYNTEYDSVPQVIDFDFDSFIDINEVLGDFTISSQAGPATYLSSTYDIGFMNNLIISPFASVTNAEKTDERFESGYKVHVLTYTITSESGSPQVYTHEIYERQTEIESVEKNNNVVSLEDVFATREDDNTTFTIDLGLNQAIDDDGIYFYGDPDQVFDIQIVDDLGNLKTYEGISWYYDEYLHIDVSIETLPGDYYIQIRYYRNLTDFIEFKTSLGSNLKITKLQGTDAYLDDIRFSEFANETNYPELAVYDSPGYGDGGPLNTEYDPQAYFNGFDYDGSRIALERYFRIDGQVSNVPLDDYQPIFDGFIPVGAIVERRDWNGSAWVWVSDLSADFTKDPVTGIEPGPEDDKVTIRYRVVPEDGNVNNIVYYDISVTDVVFNVTFIFDIYYCSEGLEGSCVLAKDSVDFNQQLVIINVQNIITDGNQTFASDDPANYPTFSQVSGLVNKTIQFYYTDSDDYTYRFARNRSYFYNFAIELPKDEYLNDLYDYSIEFEIGLDTYDLNDASDYVPGLQGKYYYIQDSVNLRTRRFNVYIYPIENPSTDKPFGLFDFFRTWGQNNE
ncbi:MAG: hypothetical protein AB7E09_02205 [Candidatus Izemoplasmatales bacterium]